MQVLSEETTIKLSLVGSIVVIMFAVMNYLGNYATKAEIKEMSQEISAKVDDTNRRMVRLDKRIDALLMRDAKRDASLDDEDLDSIRFGRARPIRRNIMDRGL